MTTKTEPKAAGKTPKPEAGKHSGPAPAHSGPAPAGDAKASPDASVPPRVAVGDVFEVEDQCGLFMLTKVRPGYVALLELGPDTRCLRNPEPFDSEPQRIRKSVVDSCTGGFGWKRTATARELAELLPKWF